MEISLSTRHGHISESTQSKVKGKIEKLIRHFDRITSVVVTIDLDNEQKPEADIRVTTEHWGDFVARDQNEGLLTAVENAVHKLDQQLRKNKDKVQERHRQPGARRQANEVNSETDDEAEVEPEYETE